MDPPSQSERAALGRANALALAHARFARAALTVYLGAAALGVGLLLTSLVTDRAHDEEQIRERLLLETDLGAHSLAAHLGRLGGELRRLGTRSEVNLFDQNLAPEQSLLNLSHERSTFFNLGVAIIDPSGEVAYAVPESFLRPGRSFANESWFQTARRDPTTIIEPVQPDRPDSVLYVVSPIIRADQFAGALLGGIDVAQDGPIAEQKALAHVTTVLATREGVVVFPPLPPSFATEESWKALFSSMQGRPAQGGAEAGFARAPIRPFTETTRLGGVTAVVAGSPVSETNFVMLSVGERDELYRPAQSRFLTRMLTGLVLAVIPILLLVLMLQRSLKVFRRNEEAAVREERLRLLGEAANSIAHEVKNSLNGLSMGLELVVRPTDAARRERLLGELRAEISRLSEFTTELMTFSKGIEPRSASLDVAEFLQKITALMKEQAAERSTELDLATPADVMRIKADPTLLHVVISNLVGNALDAVSSNAPDAHPRVHVELARGRGTAEIRVVDNGTGVSPSMRGRLFEPFQTGKPNGVGIGLALSRKIARAHGGDLVLERRPDGASFLLTLPLEDV